MAGGVTLVYLDIDDEITSAAARIRVAEEVRVALVVPSGSRLATSRINFRLLAREAQGRSRQLIIVAPDGATRSLAASAGLAVYATVRELEEAFADPAATGGPMGGPPVVPPGAGPADDAGPPLAASAADAPLAGLARPIEKGARGRQPGDTEPTRVIPADRGPMARPLGDVGSGTAGAYEQPSRGSSGRGGGPNLPVVGGGDRRGGGHRTALVVGGAVVLLAALVGGVLGYVFLPAATIVVTPKVEPISLTFNVTADPTVTEPDAVNAAVPATVVTFPLTASNEFPATGKKVTTTKAAGVVTFSSFDPARSNTIPAGSIVSTTSDVQFVTTNAVHLPPATLVTNGSSVTVVPSTGDSKVTAVKGGVDGNVDAGAIRVVPAGENGVTTKVTNQAPTTGGTRTETLQVSQKDIDAATAKLTKDLADQLDAVIADPSQAAPGATVFPDTKAMTAPTSSIDPTTLVGQIVETFTFDLSATGSVTAVDETAVQDVATARLLSNVGADHALVKGSLEVTVGKGRVQGGAIVFPVRASASDARTVVADDLIPAVRGRTAAEARTILTTYGDVTIDLWPGFSDRIPTYDFRIDLTVHQVAPLESPGAGSPSASPKQTVKPSGLNVTTPSPAPASSTATEAPSATDGASPSP